MIKLYKITADYRNDIEPREVFYVMARDKRGAVYRFQSLLPWYKYFKCEVVKRYETAEILKDKSIKLIGNKALNR